MAGKTSGSFHPKLKIRSRRDCLARPLASAGFGVALSGMACAMPLSAPEFDRLAAQCGPSAAPSTLASIAKVESLLQPLAIHDNTTGRQDLPSTPEDAVDIASRLLRAGHSLDLGLMQINSSTLSKLGITPGEAFDACVSIGAAAKILSADYVGGDTPETQQAALRKALSRYNTGDPDRGFRNGYVHKVELAARQIVPPLDPPPPLDPDAAPAAPKPDPPDRSAPPAWDVWGSYEYEEVSKKRGAPRESSEAGPDGASQSDATKIKDTDDHF